MRILILGSLGMLGHKLFQELSKEHQVYGTIKGKQESLLSKYDFMDKTKILFADATIPYSFELIIKRLNPEVIINCIGMVKSSIEDNGYTKAIWVNSLFPHQLSDMCSSHGIKLIHMSTDCVFSGSDGFYKETDKPDGSDIYGKTKLMGESIKGLVIRTSIIGRELYGNKNLIEWFLKQNGQINGYNNALFSGFTTLEFSKVINLILQKRINLSGIYHVASNPISKYDLLTKLKDKMNLPMVINKFENFKINRILNGSLFKELTGYEAPSWGKMLDDFIIDNEQYKENNNVK